jgi:hypothetical protein
LILLAACSPAPVTATEAAPQPTVELGVPVLQTQVGIPPAATDVVAAGMTTHTDNTSRYSFDYPSTWMLDPIVLGTRAPGGYQLTSWAHDPGTITEIQPGGTAMNIFVQLWEPHNDLEAFTAQHTQSWESSGTIVLSQESLTLANGQPAREFALQGPDGVQSYLLYSILGENYLVASGTGDMEVIRGVARSLR